MDVFEAIRTTRAMRRLDNERPVSDEDLWTILEAASKGATGGNAQPVRWVVVRDAEKKRRLGEIYKQCWEQVGAMYRQRTSAEVRGVLGMPDDITTWAMIPVGYPTGKWGEAKRRPIEEITYWDSWRETRTR